MTGARERLAVAVLALAAVTASGCFGSGCFVDGHRFVWVQPELAAAIRSADGNVTYSGTGGGLPFGGPLPSNATAATGFEDPRPLAVLARVEHSWGGSWSGHTALGVSHAGAARFEALYDSGDRKSSVRDRLAGFVATATDATEAEQAQVVQALLAGWDPLSNEVKLRGSAPAPGTVQTDRLFAEHGSAWAVRRPGHWEAGEGRWTFEARTVSWALPLADWQETSLEADAAGAVAGPRLPVDDPAKEPPPDLHALAALTRERLGQLGLPAPDLGAAVAVGSGKVCID